MVERKTDGTHPFINFEVRLERAPLPAMLLLGEAKSKIEHIANAPILPEVQQEMHLMYLSKGIHATTAIEGNTLTEENVRDIVEHRFKAPRSLRYQEQEINNVLDACNSMRDVDWVRELSEDDLKRFDQLILRELELQPEVVPGEYRTYTVTAGGYRAPHAQDVPKLMRDFINWLRDFPLDGLGPDRRLHLAILKAIYAHLFFVWIHPFGDGNGRTARIIELRILLSAGVPTPAAHLLSNHYNMTRNRYYLKLNEARNNIWAFVEYALEGFVDGLAEQITKIQEQQKQVMWIHLVRNLVTGLTPSASRKRTLARVLGDFNVPVTKSQIPKLTVELAEVYAGKTQKTVARDISDLKALGLLTVDGSTVRANWDQVLSLLPLSLPDALLDHPSGK